MSDPAGHDADAATGTPAGDREEDAFTPDEVRHLAERYGLGEPSSARVVGRGHRGARLLKLETDWGPVLVKRRALVEPARAAFTHRVRQFLLLRGVPVPALLGTVDENNSLVVYHAQVYEASAWIEGRACEVCPADARAGGAALGRLHAVGADAPAELRDHPKAEMAGPFATDTRSLTDAVHRRGADAAHALLEFYLAAQEPDASGHRTVLLHGDWHVGNLVLGPSRVEPELLAILDLDHARFGAPADDLGAALLYHSMSREDGPCDDWPDEPDVESLAAAWHGYRDGIGGQAAPPAPEPTVRAMIRALCGEALVRGLGGSRLGRHEAAAFLRMAGRKAEWLYEHGPEAIPPGD